MYMSKIPDRDVNCQLFTPQYSPQTMASAPQYLVDPSKAHFDPFAPSLSVIPATPGNPTPYASFIYYPSTTTNTVSTGVQHYHQHEQPLHFQMLAGGSYQTYISHNAYRFPPPLAAPLACSIISENGKCGRSSNFPRADAPQISNAAISDVRLSPVSQPAIKDESSYMFKQLVRPFPKLIVPEVTPGRSTSGSMPSATLHSTVPLGLVIPCTQLSQSKSTAHSIPSESTSKRSKKSKIRHSCTLCDQSFTRAHDLKRHNTIHERCKAFPCLYCSKTFGRKDALTRHIAVRGTNHHDLTKKAASKPRRPPAGLPNITARLPSVGEDSRASKLELPEPTSLETCDLTEVTVQGRASVCKANRDMKDGCFKTSNDICTDSSSRASSISLVGMNASLFNKPDSYQPFDFDGDSSLVQGLPSAHLQLDLTNLPHPIMHSFASPYYL